MANLFSSAQLCSLINHFFSSVMPPKTNCHCFLCFPPNCNRVTFHDNFLLHRERGLNGEKTCLNKWMRPRSEGVHRSWTLVQNEIQ